MERIKVIDVEKVIIGRSITDMTNFDWIEKEIPAHIPHRYINLDKVISLIIQVFYLFHA